MPNDLPRLTPDQEAAIRNRNRTRCVLNEYSIVANDVALLLAELTAVQQERDALSTQVEHLSRHIRKLEDGSHA